MAQQYFITPQDRARERKILEAFSLAWGKIGVQLPPSACVSGLLLSPQAGDCTLVAQACLGIKGRGLHPSDRYPEIRYPAGQYRRGISFSAMTQINFVVCYLFTDGIFYATTGPGQPLQGILEQAEEKVSLLPREAFRKLPGEFDLNFYLQEED